MRLSLLTKVFIHNNRKVTDFQKVNIAAVLYELLEDKNSKKDSLEHKANYFYSNEQPDSDKVMMTLPCNTNYLPEVK